MHIPDGYLSPAFSLGLGVATVPVWGVATKKVQKAMDNRTAPLLAVFSAFAFTVMMFNIPVPGGTTAHGVGGTLLAIVLGPWAAVIGVSVALIIQALFFGDGGVLAIFANCLNMGVLLPFTGYGLYRLIAGNSSIMSTRRVWAAAIGGYAGITLAGLAVGVELGLQPILFRDAAGQAIYSPYGFGEAIPAMLIAHVFGASIVEGVITAFGLTYLRRTHPEYFAGVAGAADAGRGSYGPALVTVTLAGVVALFVAGLVAGGGNPSGLFGADWESVDWPGVATMLLITGVLAAVLAPLAYFLLPKDIKTVGATFVLLSVLAPLGLIAPGFAYGEGSAEDVQSAFGYVPEGLQRFSDFFSAPLKDYNLPLPFFAEADAPLWHQAVGYEISGMLGMLLVGVLAWGLAALLRKLGGGSHPTVEAPTG